MSMERQMEVVRYGRFAVFDRGEARTGNEAAADRPRYAVVEHDAKGPILRAGPYRVLGNAVESCQLFNFRDELLRREGRDAEAT